VAALQVDGFEVGAGGRLAVAERLGRVAQSFEGLRQHGVAEAVLAAEGDGALGVVAGGVRLAVGEQVGAQAGVDLGHRLLVADRQAVREALLQLVPGPLVQRRLTHAFVNLTPLVRGAAPRFGRIARQVDVSAPTKRIAPATRWWPAWSRISRCISRQTRT